MRSLFDDLAPSYDRTFSSTVLGGLLRDAVHEELRQVFHAGDRILDIGCGTGEDALRLHEQGISVHGVDASSEMIALAMAKANDALGCCPPSERPPGGRRANVEFEVRDISERGLPNGPFDGALANFGVVNCLRDVRRFSDDLRRSLKPQGRVVLVAMGRYCLWDWLWYVPRGKPDLAARRIAGRVDFRRATIRYWTPAQLASQFPPQFRSLGHKPIGLLLPPTFAAGAAERYPSVSRALAAMERTLRAARVGSSLSDHFLLELERL